MCRLDPTFADHLKIELGIVSLLFRTKKGELFCYSELELKAQDWNPD